jgi:hypothetical protein
LTSIAKQVEQALPWYPNNRGAEGILVTVNFFSDLMLLEIKG